MKNRRGGLWRLPLWVACALCWGCGSATDDRPADWDYISPAIIQPNCATVSCHSRAAAVAGLDFSTPARGYKSLTGLWVWIVDPDGTAQGNCKKEQGQVVCQRGFRPLVTPYNPSQSRLVNMLRARGADRMPPDRPLPEADIRLIELWILDGAKKGGVSLPAMPASPPSMGPPDGAAPAPPAADGGAVEAGATDAGAAGG